MLINEIWGSFNSTKSSSTLVLLLTLFFSPPTIQVSANMSQPDLHIDPSVAHFNMPFETYLGQLQTSRPELGGLATGAIIFSNDVQPRVLLVQRAPHDSMPNKWEIAGGAVDGGETVLAGVAREVCEEVGLRVTRVRGLVRMANGDGDDGLLQGGHVFRTTRGRHVVKYTFVVDVDDASRVRLDPNEHQDYVWATEQECRSKQVAREDGGAALELQFTTPAQEEAILKAFAEYQP